MILATVRSICLYIFYLVIPIVISTCLKFAANPKQRGFFCFDDSIRLPYASDRVKWWQACVIAAVFPLVLFCVDAVCRRVSNGGASTVEKDGTGAALSPPKPLMKISNSILPCLLAFVANGLFLNAVVDIGKYGFGRLRPHFLSVCQPTIHNGSDLIGGCADLPPFAAHEFIAPRAAAGEREEAGLSYDCRGSSSKVKKGRQSFPSGHTAVLFYSMTYAFVYLQMNVKRLPLVRNFVQFLCVISAMGVSLSRMVDHAHHAEDVVAGAFLGVLAASHALFNPLPLRQESGSTIHVDMPHQNHEQKIEHQL